MRGRDENDGAPDELVGESVAGSSDSEAHRDHGFVGHVGRVVAEERDDLLHPVDRMRHEAFGHCRTDGMQPELERGDDAEIGAGSAHTPEEVGVPSSPARTICPSAVTSSIDNTLSVVSPCLR